MTFVLFLTDKSPNPRDNELDLSTPEKTASLGTPFSRNTNMADSEEVIKKSIPANVAIP